MGQICFKKFHFVFPDEFLYTVIQKMNSHPFDSIPVISRTVEQNVIGIVTSEKIMALLSLEEKKKNQINDLKFQEKAIINFLDQLMENA